jgi:hypothetical protein
MQVDEWRGFVKVAEIELERGTSVMSSSTTTHQRAGLSDQLKTAQAWKSKVAAARGTLADKRRALFDACQQTHNLRNSLHSACLSLLQADAALAHFDSMPSAAAVAHPLGLEHDSSSAAHGNASEDEQQAPSKPAPAPELQQQSPEAASAAMLADEQFQAERKHIAEQQAALQAIVAHLDQEVTEVQAEISVIDSELLSAQGQAQAAEAREKRLRQQVVDAEGAGQPQLVCDHLHTEVASAAIEQRQAESAAAELQAWRSRLEQLLGNTVTEHSAQDQQLALLNEQLHVHSQARCWRITSRQMSTSCQSLRLKCTLCPDTRSAQYAPLD